jgi:predicted MFS family arabinose efflux permease
VRKLSPAIGLAAFGFAYLMSQFYRSALTVIAPELMADLKLDAASLGTLSAAWFISFALMQIPIGLALDRFGPRRTVAGLMGVAVLGTVIFARAGSLAAAVAGQLLIGVGCAPVFVGTMVAVARWFPPERFATLSSIVLSCASAGTLLSSRPFAMAAEWLGWRGAMLVAAGLTMLSLMLVAALARGPSHVPESEERTEPFGDLLRGLGAVARIRELWPILPMAFIAYAVFITLRGLWAGPYLAEVFGLSPIARGDVLLVMSMALPAGTLLHAWAERRWRSRRRPVLLGSWLAVGCLIALIPLGDSSLLLSAAMLTLTVACGATYVLIMTQGRQFLPAHQVGRGITLLNFANFLGAAILQQTSGFVAQHARDLGQAPSAVYGWVFAFLAGCLALALIAYWFSRDRPAD